MNEIKIFENPQFGALRTTERNGELWFVGKDVAELLGYAKPQNAIATHVDDEDKALAPIQGGCSTGTQNTTIINESGLYSLILSSKLPSAKAFKHWVTSEILPSISRTGGYNTDPTMRNIVQTLAAMQRALEAQQEINKRLLGRLDMPPTVPDEPEQLVLSETVMTPTGYIRGQKSYVRGQKADTEKIVRVRWFNRKLYNNLYNRYPKTLHELAQEIGVHVSTMRTWRNGRCRPSVSNARKLAAALGVAEDELFLE